MAFQSNLLQPKSYDFTKRLTISWQKCWFYSFEKLKIYVGNLSEVIKVSLQIELYSLQNLSA